MIKVPIQITCSKCKKSYSVYIELDEDTYEKHSESMGAETHYYGTYIGSCLDSDCQTEHTVTLSIWEYPKGTCETYEFEVQKNCEAKLNCSVSGMFVFD